MSFDAECRGIEPALYRQDKKRKPSLSTAVDRPFCQTCWPVLWATLRDPRTIIVQERTPLGGENKFKPVIAMEMRTRKKSSHT